MITVMLTNLSDYFDFKLIHPEDLADLNKEAKHNFKWVELDEYEILDLLNLLKNIKDLTKIGINK